MNTLIILLFCLQGFSLIIVMFALVLVVLPIRRLSNPIKKLADVIIALSQNVNTLGKAIQSSITQVVRHFARFSRIFKGTANRGLLFVSLKKVFSFLLAGRQLFGVLKRLKGLQRNKFWGMFRLLMFAGPVVVPVLSTLKKMLRKTASAG